jgi:hypothetical protein
MWTAAQLADPARDARWRARREGPEARVFRAVLRAFVERAGPVPVEAVVASLPELDAARVRESLARLDADDLLVLAGGAVDVAYPFAGRPTPFVVDLPGGQSRFSCCAIDALGIAPMVGGRVQVRAPCHQSGAPLAFPVDPDGPGAAAAGVMVWVARPGEDARRCTDTL